MEETPGRPEIEGRSAFSTGLAVLISLSLLTGGIQGIAMSLKRSTLSCQRLESTYIECELISSGITGARRTQISSLLGVDLETQINSYDSSESYQIILVTPDLRYPLMPEFYSGSDVKAKAYQIHTFVHNSSETSLVVQQRGRWYSFVFGCLYAFLGGGSIVFWWHHRRT